MTQMSLDGSIPSITKDPDYPALIRELAEVLTTQLRSGGVEPTSAEAIAEACAEYVREHFGGQPLYWAKGETMRQRLKREAMWAEFNGRNHAELARKHGICLQQVYKRLAISRAEHRARQQPDLFGQAGQEPEHADPA